MSLELHKDRYVRQVKSYWGLAYMYYMDWSLALSFKVVDKMESLAGISEPFDLGVVQFLVCL